MKKFSLCFTFLLVWLLSLSFGCYLPEPERFDPVSGEQKGMALAGEVRVVRDRHGLCHIRAGNDADLFYAIGYAMAQDRFSMMDALRRAGAGRLSELLGSPGKYKDYDLPHLDLGLRVFRFEETARRGVAQLDPESRSQLESFARGVNKFLADGGHTLALYQGFGIPPEPWKVEDCFLVAEVMGLAMTISSFFEEYYLERIRRENGDEVRDFFVPQYPDHEVIITRDEPMLPTPSAFLPRPFSALGSNNWALAPSRSMSGKPLLANDPHVPYTVIPTFWWHCQITSPNYNVMGMMFPGFPCFGAATNGQLGWALTNVMADYIDIWREKIKPEDPDLYLDRGEWRRFEKEEGVVKVRDKKPVPYTMRFSRHGAVIDQKLLGWKVPTEKDEVLVVKYVDMDLARWYAGYQKMARAKNFEEWLAGAKDEAWGPFAWNHVYADAAGNIAYWATGHFPLRQDQQGYIARKGWEEEQDWKGWVPFEENPHLVNPKKGYLVTANNRAELPGYPHYITVDYVSPSRASRITELIEQKPKLDVEDMKRIQSDVSPWSARKVVPLLLSDLEATKDRDLRLAAELLREWKEQGYQASLEARGVCLYEVFMANFAEAVFADELNEKTARGASYSGLLAAGLTKILDQPDSAWFDNKKTKVKETRKEMVRKVMKESVGYLRKQLGADPRKWRWGDLHRTFFSPTLLPIPGTPAKYSLGPYPLAGTEETVRAAESLFLGPLGFISVGGPSTHFIVDFQDPKKIYFNCTTGPADNPKSQRYQNLTPAWFNNQYFTMSMEETEYREGMMGELILFP